METETATVMAIVKDQVKVPSMEHLTEPAKENSTVTEMVIPMGVLLDQTMESPMETKMDPSKEHQKVIKRDCSMVPATATGMETLKVH